MPKHLAAQVSGAPRILFIEQLSALIGKTATTIRTCATNAKYQHLIPTPFKLPHSRRLCWYDRNRTVAEVASKLFGAAITEHDVIGETLERVTDPLKDVAAIAAELPSAIQRESHQWADFDAFRRDPLAIWVELNLGIELPDNEPPRRAKPITLQAASDRLAQDAGCDPGTARAAFQRFLVAAHDVRTPQGRAPFAFKLHQFISGPGKLRQKTGHCEEGNVAFAACQHVKAEISLLEHAGIRDARDKKNLQRAMDESVARAGRLLSRKDELQRRIEAMQGDETTLMAAQRRTRMSRGTAAVEANKWPDLLDELGRWESSAGSTQAQADINASRDHSAQIEQELNGVQTKLTVLQQNKSEREKALASITDGLAQQLFPDGAFGTFDPRDEQRPFRLSMRGGEAFRVLEVLLGDVAAVPIWLFHVRRRNARTGGRCGYISRCPPGPCRVKMAACVLCLLLPPP